ncbi:bacteriocin immunity protein [Latilactobacillus sakei]|uniref:bacteriocin immunity protein n=1 Tax=Latilactobacillus sakei TaxID=1599 RepID=UPI003884B7A9
MTNQSMVKKNIHTLYNSLISHPDKSNALLDITDVLSQVYLTLETAKNPEALVNRLSNYIYSVGFGKIHLNKSEEQLLIDLGAYGQRAGWNSVYRGDYTAKAEFFNYSDARKYARV